ncbi:MAG: hypothetical protein JW941_08470 [Candidatus Coatesbacteria bacterium]|nr:hypothetical protein [Candidatus Coatesbacteria bacterium]
MRFFSMRSACVIALLGFCLVSAGLSALATSPGEFLTEGKGPFDGCELDRVTLTDEGKIILSVSLEKAAELKDAQVWAVAADKSGNIYAGTGDEGKLYVLRHNSEPRVLYDSDEQQIHSVMIDARDRVYIGTGPSGKVFRIDPENGNATRLFETGEKYVWALASGSKGEIYAGTGPSGKVFRITGPEKGEVLLELGSPNITALTFDANGDRLLIGTSTGVVYSLIGKGKPRAHFEAEGAEIRTILLDGGDLFVLSMGGSGGPPAGASAPEMPPDAGSMPDAMKAAIIAAKNGPAAKPPAKRAMSSRFSKAKSAIYRIYGSGRTERIFGTEDGMLFSMSWYKSDIYAFGYRRDEGVVVRVNKDGDADLLRSIDDTKFISASEIPGDGFALGTCEAANIYVLRPEEMEKSGTLISEVQDAASRANWGKVSWTAEIPKGTKVEFFTRSGDVSKVDSSWGDWEGPLEDSEGSTCKSPEARYIQYKAVLSKDRGNESPSLERVAISYIQANLPPEIENIEIHDAGKDPSDIARSAKAAGAAEKYENLKQLDKFSDFEERETLRFITWQASDPNGDDLTYSVYLKPVKGNWHEIVKDTEMTFGIINSSTLADGKYLIRVSASDILSNSESDALTADEESDEFMIDNTAPVVEFKRVKRLADGRALVSGTIWDESSNLTGAWWSSDLNPFVVLHPKDGLLDSKREEFEITTPVVDGSSQFFVIRVEDSCGNIIVARKELIR